MSSVMEIGTETRAALAARLDERCADDVGALDERELASHLQELERLARSVEHSHQSKGRSTDRCGRGPAC